jgi:hypothetical protein
VQTHIGSRFLGASSAGAQDLDRLLKRGLRYPKLHDAMLYLSQLPLKQFSDSDGNIRSGLSVLPVPEKCLDLSQRHFNLLQNFDQPQSPKCTFLVEAEATPCTGGRLDQSKLLVISNRPHRCPRPLCEITDAHQITVIAIPFLISHSHYRDF